MSDTEQKPESKTVNFEVSEKAAKALELFAEKIIKNNKSELMWRSVKIWGSCIVLGLVLFTTAYEQYREKSTNRVSIVEISGTIGSGGGSAEAVVESLKTAFNDQESAAVILAIDSPGGVPSDADRISDVIEQYKEKTKKPVIAVVDGMGASAAYMIAIHADKIVAGRYSVVGSIGAVMNSWDYHQVMQKVGVKQNVFVSGKLKAMLNPYEEMTPEARAKAQDIVDKIGGTFHKDVLAKRGSKLKTEDIASGEVWSGEDALKIGLIDEIGTLDAFLEKNYPENKVKRLKPSIKKYPWSMEFITPELVAQVAEFAFGK